MKAEISSQIEVMREQLREMTEKVYFLACSEDGPTFLNPENAYWSKVMLDYLEDLADLRMCFLLADRILASVEQTLGANP